MRTEVIEVKQYLPYKRIFGNMNLSAFKYTIANVYMDEKYISYDLIKEDNEVSITITFNEYFRMENIVMSLENDDKTLVENFKIVWSE